jgi:hypothetical protein
VAEITEKKFIFVFFINVWGRFFLKKIGVKLEMGKKVARSGAFPPDPGKPLADNYKFVFFGTR